MVDCPRTLIFLLLVLDRFRCRHFPSETPEWRGKPVAPVCFDVTRPATGVECYDMHRLIVTHKKVSFYLLVRQEGKFLPSCASQSSARASAIAERYNVVR